MSSSKACFSPETIEAIGSYVYGLIDPRAPGSEPKRFFYVGKGSKNRCFHHAAAEIQWQPNGEPNLKLRRIRAIRRATGHPPPIQIIAHNLDRHASQFTEESYRLEAALISVLQTDKKYCGAVCGIGGAYCSLTVDEIEGLYSNPLKESELGHRVLLVSLNGGANLPPYPDILPPKIPERVLGWWPLAGDKADEVEYIIGCYRLLTKVVFKVNREDGRAVHRRVKCGKNKNGYPIWKRVFTGKRSPEMEDFWRNRRIVDSDGMICTKFRWGVGTRLIGKRA